MARRRFTRNQQHREHLIAHPEQLADWLIHDLVSGDPRLSDAERIALAGVVAQIAAVREARTANLLAAIEVAKAGHLSDHTHDDVTRLAVSLRHRLGLPVKPLFRDGTQPNGVGR